MKSLLKIIKDKKQSTLENKINLRKYYENVLKNHEYDLIGLKVAIYQKFKNEYYEKNDDILKIYFEYNIDNYLGGNKTIVIYNKIGHRLVSCEKFVIDSRCDIDKELRNTYPGIYSKFSAKQIIASSLNNENPIITYCISREDFEKSMKNIIEREETVNNKYSIKKKLSYTFK